MQTNYNSILSNLKIKALNEMQQASIEAGKSGKDMILLSATGSGKTIAFLLPVLNALKKDVKTVQSIIIVPSRELALQIDDVWRKMQTGYKATVCYGGHKREIEETNLIESPALIIGTPGRLADHIRRNNFSTAGIRLLVLDEFDKSLELGFVEEMEFIIGELKSLDKRILTSATAIADVPGFVGLDQPLRLDYLPGESQKAERLEIKTVFSEQKDKAETLFRLICFLGNRSTIIFCNHRDAVERTNSILKEKGIVTVFYHGGMEQQQRDEALCKFRNGTSSILVTTDLAARGLDIPNIRNIIHYHLPGGEDIFTHRNGRTARMEASGTAYVIYSDGEVLPEYISAHATDLALPKTAVLPEKPKWSTLFIAAGKKDKVNKVDIVGFFGQKGKLKKEDIGVIEVKDFFSFVAIKKIKVSEVLQLIKDQKIKNKKVKIAIAK
ncbi:MAG: DEAD/DEAH box helicase [Ferruginibacter sp.]